MACYLILWAFQDFLAGQNIALTSRVSSEVQDLAQKLQSARTEDRRADALVVKQTADTFFLLQQQQHTVEEMRNLGITTVEALQKLQAPASLNEEDLDMAEARAELVNALRLYSGAIPPLGIDSSELTVPFGEPLYVGIYSIIQKGYRNGQLVAVKKLKLYDADEVETVYRVQHDYFLFFR